MESFIILILFCILPIILNSATIKGWFGEKTISLILNNLPKSNYKIINNVMLRTKKGTSQIDHIVVSNYGIFVIETKNYKGQIYGNEYDNQWTQSINGRKYQFRNPLKQNYGHIKALEELLNFNENYFIPIVVFSTKSTLKTKTISPVIYSTQLKKEILRHQELKFTEEDLDKIVETIINANIDSFDTRKEHIQEVQFKKKEQNPKSSKICPKCGSLLIQRNGKRGKFIGCSNYPNCRYSRN